MFILPSRPYQAPQSFTPLHDQDYHIIDTLSFPRRIILTAVSFFLRIVFCLLLLIWSPSPGLNRGGWTRVLIQTTPAPSFYLIKTEWTATNLPLQLWIKTHRKNCESCRQDETKMYNVNRVQLVNYSTPQERLHRCVRDFIFNQQYTQWVISVIQIVNMI